MAVASSQAPYDHGYYVPKQYQDYKPEHASPDYYKPVYQHGRPYYGYHAPENKPASISDIFHFILKFHPYW